jgi:hypothetical protein
MDATADSSTGTPRETLGVEVAGSGLLRWLAKLNRTRTGAKFTRGLQEDDPSGGGGIRESGEENGERRVEERERERGGRKIRNRGGGRMAWAEVICLAKILREEVKD